MMHALVIFSPSPQLGIWRVSLELMGRGVVSRTNKVSLTMYIVNILNSCVCACACACVCSSVCGSAYGSGCMVDGGSATAAI